MSISECANVALAVLSPENAIIAVAIAGAESGWDPMAHADASTGMPLDDSYGYWQINMLGDLGPPRRLQFEITSNDQLFDPVINARAMVQISGNGSNWCAWSSYEESCGAGHNGSYRDHLAAATAAVASADPTIPPSGGPGGDPVPPTPKPPPNPYSGGVGDYSVHAQFVVAPDVHWMILLGIDDNDHFYAFVQNDSGLFVDRYSRIAAGDTDHPQFHHAVDTSALLQEHHWWHGTSEGYHGYYGQGYYGEEPVMDDVGNLWVWDLDPGFNQWVLMKGDVTDATVTFTATDIRLPATTGPANDVRMGFNPWDRSLYFVLLHPIWEAEDVSAAGDGDWQNHVCRTPVDGDEEGTVYRVYCLDDVLWPGNGYYPGPEGDIYPHDGDFCNNFAFTDANVFLAFQNHHTFAAEAMAVFPGWRTSATPGANPPFYNNTSSIGCGELCVAYGPHKVVAGGAGGANSAIYLFRNAGGEIHIGTGITDTAHEQNPGDDHFFNRFTNKYSSWLGPMSQTRAAQTKWESFLLLRSGEPTYDGSNIPYYGFGPGADGSGSGGIVIDLVDKNTTTDSPGGGSGHGGGGGGFGDDPTSGGGGSGGDNGSAGTSGSGSVVVPSPIAGAGQGQRTQWFYWDPNGDGNPYTFIATGTDAGTGAPLPIVISAYHTDSYGHISSLAELEANYSPLTSGTPSHLTLAPSTTQRIWIAVSTYVPEGGDPAPLGRYALLFTDPIDETPPPPIPPYDEPDVTAAGILIVQPYQYVFRNFLFGSGTSIITTKVDGILGMADVDNGDIDRTDHGSSPGILRMQKRPVAFDLTITGRKGTDIETKLAAARRVFQPPRIRKSHELEPLVFMRPGEPKKMLWVRCTRREFTSEYDTARGLASGSVELQAVNPRIYALEHTEGETIALASGVTSATVFCEMEGDYEDGTPPRIWIQGPWTNPVLTNATDGRVIRLNMILDADQELILRNKQVWWKAGLDQPFQKYYQVVLDTNQWWNLIPGTNEIVCERDAGNVGATGRIQFIWRDAYA